MYIHNYIRYIIANINVIKYCIINKNTIIFSPGFNEILQVKSIHYFNKLIFSNYKLDKKIFKLYKNKDIKDLSSLNSHCYQKKYFCCKFNQEA